MERETPTGLERRYPHTNTDEEVRQGLTRILHDKLHWLDVSERIQFKLCIHVYKCLHGIAPKYMMNLYRPVSAIEGRSHLRSATRGQLDVSRPKGQYTGEGLSHTLVNQHGTRCPTTLKTAASLLSCINDR